MPRNLIQLSFCNCSAIPALIALGWAWTSPAVADPTATTVDGKELPVDTRGFDRDYYAKDNSPGLLAKGGYCRVGPPSEKYYYDVVASKPATVDIEVVTHPPDYSYAAHDLLGALRAAAASGEPERPRVSPPHDKVVAGVRPVDWRAGNGEGGHTIFLAQSKKYPKGGIVAWYSEGENGLVTVCMRYVELEGLPKQLIDEFLAKHPSSVDKDTAMPDDWVDDDLNKWVEILRAHPKDAITMSIVLLNLRQYEREAQAAWGVMDLKPSSVEKAGVEAELDALATKIEAWRLKRKAAR